VALFAVHPMFFFGLFALYPLCFTAFPDRYEGLVTALLGIASGVSIAGWNGWTLGGWVFAAAQGGLGASFAFTMGRWIDRIIHQSRERGSLLDELESTRSELAEVHRAAGISAERDRMGTEIHDTVAQGFTSLLMLLRGAQASLDTNPEAARHLLVVAEQTAQENLDEARALVTNSRPAPLQDAPIHAALSRLASRFSAETSLATSIEVVGVPRSLDPAHDVVLLRTAQEALANIRKHARATNVQMELRFPDDHVDLEVVDDGSGFDTTKRSSGFGLSGMKSRVSQVGGALHVASSPDHGTRVQVTL
jgi:signal transduction histidine kinase